MSFEQGRHGFIFSCDECGDSWEPTPLGRSSHPRDFNESWSDAKQDGWRAKKDGDDWHHYAQHADKGTTHE